MELAGYLRISIDTGIGGGRPVVIGARMRVSDILEMLADGADVEEIVNDFPYITSADVMACLSYAASLCETPRTLREQKLFHAEFAEFCRGAEVGCGGTHPLENLRGLCVK